MAARKQTKAPPMMAEAEISIVRIAPETSFKNKAYEALKEAILKMDIYATPEQVMLDDRAQKGHLRAARFFQEFRQGPPAAGSHRGIFEGQHRLSPGPDLAQRVAGAGRYDQRYPAACSRLPAAHDRTYRPHRDLAARTHGHHRGARSARHRIGRKTR